MLGTLVNSLAILLGTGAGLLLKSKLRQNVQKSVMEGLGLCVVLMGIGDALKTQNILLMIGSIVIGGRFGALIHIEGKLEKMGTLIEKKALGNKDREKQGTFAQGFITATLVYCVGAMGIIGSIESGTQGQHHTLFAKAILDGTTAIFFASALGPGVGLSAIAVLAYQGAITLLSQWIAPFMSQGILRELSAVGGVLVFAIGINLLEIKKISVANLLPAVLLPVAYGLAFGL